MSESLALALGAELKSCIIMPGELFVMMIGTTVMPQSSAACWATPQELPLAIMEVVSESSS